jgi:ATP-binding protein involved in chromosome partitioning
MPEKQSVKRPQAVFNREPVRYARHILAVASGKGGVGKSTSTVNLAHALAQQGLQIGILDADIYGPSIPRMMGLLDAGVPQITDNQMQPHMAYGIQTMSMGYITGDQAAILRAPMITKALQQMLRGSAWGSMHTPLDILLIDMPPGTGDITLSLAQSCALSGVVIVTTPQDVAVMDAKKCLIAFEKLAVPVLGVIENMSGLMMEDGTIQPIFGKDGGKKLAKETSKNFLGDIPLIPQIAQLADKGENYITNKPTNNPYTLIANKITKALEVELF